MAARTLFPLWLTALVACHAPVPGEHGPYSMEATGALGDPVGYATDDQLATFQRGHDVAVRRFTRAGGLGPAFNISSCAGCHEKPLVGGGAGLYRNFLLSAVVGSDGAYLPAESAGMAGGVVRMYHYGPNEGGIARPAVPDEVNVIAQRNPIPFFGVGLIAELPEDVILANADPDDKDRDGISGRPNYDRGFVGRFGMKAQTVSIEGFIRGPLFNHGGITSDPLTDDQRGALPVNSSDQDAAADSRTRAFVDDLLRFAQAAAPDGPTVDDDGVADPELSTDDLFDLVSFAMLLAAPRPDDLDATTKHGAVLFDTVGCNACHLPRLEGPHGALPIYSDLLLHDMGDGLADQVIMKEATGREFRTQPLWGITAVGPYLHDGRSSTLDGAIRWHGGEAEGAVDAYKALDDGDREDLLAFLASLGGAAQRTEGLIPPGTPAPRVGEWGGPVAALSGDALTRFEAGRALFDRDFGVEDGAGAPRFNGDSCRACHFDPVLGGAGPLDVNVMRHGVITPSGAFAQPYVGTILHKQTILSNVAVRAQAEAAIFEHRQTPHLFGLGLIDAIPDDVIAANADPDDARDHDGIRGRVAIVDGGRVGRFGWKAQVPTVDEFVRDALSAEIGLSLPLQPGLTFGRLQDNDGHPDPELTLDDTALLADYLRSLGPPPRTPATDTAAAATGEGLFHSVGCAACHVPALQGASGPVPLYSDLLLHTVLPDDALGTEDGAADMREFRTAPLWGVARTAPYLHSGEAADLDAAIRLHAGEASASRDTYQALDEASRKALVAFLETL
jgi:CxxC motif-containing protein (DUF1111 family)